MSNSLALRPDDAIKILEGLFDWYSSQELEWRGKLDNGVTWNESYESEWMRYRREAAALRAGIEAIRSSLTVSGKS